MAKGKNDFDKFVSTALDAVVTDVPTEGGDVDTSSVPINLPKGVDPSLLVPQPVGVQSEQTAPPLAYRAPVYDPEAGNRAAYQQMLRQEEAMLEARRVAAAAAPPPVMRPAPDQESQDAYRAMLRREEERLSKMPKPAPLPTGPVVGGAAGTLPLLKPKDGTDPLLVEAGNMLRELLFGGMLIPSEVLRARVRGLGEKIRTQVEG